MPARRGKLPRGWVATEKAAKPTVPDRPRPEPRRDTDGRPVMADGQLNPSGTGRYCPPALCWCGTCPHWTPPPPIAYAATITRLQRAQAYLPPVTEIED